MPVTNLIVNGTFSAGSSGWSGTDIEAAYPETSYISGDASNIVAEIDGNSGQTTVMQQSFFVSEPITTALTLDTALRFASNPNAGFEGFSVDILNSSGQIIAGMNIFPTSNTMTTYSLPVTFPSAGTYTVRFTERGPDDSLGAIVDNIELLVCFAGETQISTKAGSKPVQDVRVGDVVQTLRGPQPVRWIGRRSVTAPSMAQDTKLRPVRISAGALGHGLPTQDLRVSRQHRMLVRSPICRRMFGAEDVLVAAARLLDLPGVSIDSSEAPLDYYHILFDRHEVVLANGAPAESLLLTETSLSSLSAESQADLRHRYPDIGSPTHDPVPAAIIPERVRQKTLIRRLQKNKRQVLETPVRGCGTAIVAA